eukprot:2367307-Rhodomonas_salina.1
MLLRARVVLRESAFATRLLSVEPAERLGEGWEEVKQDPLFQVQILLLSAYASPMPCPLPAYASPIPCPLPACASPMPCPLPAYASHMPCQLPAYVSRIMSAILLCLCYAMSTTDLGYGGTRVCLPGTFSPPLSPPLSLVSSALSSMQCP